MQTKPGTAGQREKERGASVTTSPDVTFHPVSCRLAGRPSAAAHLVPRQRSYKHAGSTAN